MAKGADGKPLADADVSVLFVMPATPAMGEMRNEVKLKSAGAGKYTGTGNVTMAGKWSLLHD
jgi:YtkA-like